ncbi:hypothetical protein HSBAA_PA_3160 (plasmid) [Vreelandella sulfidaeris]|uniref:YeeE/YedE family protein n=1 Tax=Vreelandella sulfidaeris TaxID=115553 RepID=A0A455UK22_9GAMM|nr:hypothetical protein HSBAA_PA_3160 [Halomonas sulfidaeris]
MKTLMGYLAGLLFGLGLAIGGMTDPTRVLNFLDVFGDWDPTLMFVLGGAVTTTFIGYRLVLRRSQPLFAQAFQLPTRRDLDGRLMGGRSCSNWLGIVRLLPRTSIRLFRWADHATHGNATVDDRRMVAGKAVLRQSLIGA